MVQIDGLHIHAIHYRISPLSHQTSSSNPLQIYEIYSKFQRNLNRNIEIWHNVLYKMLRLRGVVKFFKWMEVYHINRSPHLFYLFPISFFFVQTEVITQCFNALKYKNVSIRCKNVFEWRVDKKCF